jgi:hypothetical protein
MFLSDLGKFIRASGSASVAGEIDYIAARLSPFAGYKLKAFADFLGKAEEYSRGALAPKPTRAPRAKADPAAAERACQRVSELYDRAIDPSITVDAIEEGVRSLQEADPPKARLDELTQRFGFSRKFKSKPEALKAIREKILGRKGAFDRVNA